MTDMTDHPDDFALLAFALGDEDVAVAAHLQKCTICGDAVDRHREATADSLAAAATQFRWPEPVATAFSAEPPEPEVGHLWRTEWDDVVQLIYIVDVDAAEDLVAAAPIVDTEAGDESALFISAQLLGWKAAIVTSLGTQIPVRVLDQWLGVLPRESREGHVWAPITRDTDERVHVHAVVQDRLQVLARANWVPASANESALTEELRRRWTKPSALAAALGINPAAARELLDGTRTPTEGERAALRTARLDVAMDAPPPPELVWATDRPSVRPLWHADAAANGTVDSPAYRWAAYTDQRFALAARDTTHSPGSKEWWLARVRGALSGRT
jgi:hypothetical protein